jgi:hypothetical protein
MPRTGWTPSIVAKGDDQNVYLAVDDFGRKGRAYREADVEATDLETVIADLLDGRIKTRSGGSVSTPPRNGRRMYRPTWRTKCAIAAISKGATYHFSCKTLSTDTMVDITMCSCRCQCGLYDPRRTDR